MADENQRERILCEARDLCIQLNIEDFHPSEVVWSKLVPRWGLVDIGRPLLLDDKICIHEDLKGLTDDQAKALIAFSLVRSKKTGKHLRLVGLTIVGSLFAVIILSFLLLPLVLPERVPFTDRAGVLIGYGALGSWIALFVEPVILAFVGIFIISRYGQKRTGQADRQVASLLRKDSLLEGLRAILASVPEPSPGSRRAGDKQLRRNLNDVKRRIRAIESE
jgi:hypothetical protein